MRLLQVVEVHQPVGPQARQSHLKSFMREPLGGTEHRLVLGSHGDDMVAAIPVPVRHALDGQVVGFARSRGEDNLLGAGVNQLGHLLARVLHCRSRCPVLKNLDVDIEQTRQGDFKEELDPNFAAQPGEEPQPGGGGAESPAENKCGSAAEKKGEVKTPCAESFWTGSYGNCAQARRHGPGHRTQKRNRARHPNSLPSHQEQSGAAG